MTPATLHLETRGPGPRTRGFTVIEILVVVAVIILLLSILLVALGQAMTTAQGANTRVLLTSIRQSLVRFKEDIGYYPPILDHRRALVEPLYEISTEMQYRNQIPHWESVTSLPDYLLGYGDGQQDGYGQPGDETKPALGIRSPGADGVWNASLMQGRLQDRNAGTGPAVVGQVFGPYLELKDERLLGAIDPDAPSEPDGTPRVLFAGDADYTEDLPKVIVDYWGSPVHYFRRLYPPGGIKHGYRRPVEWWGDEHLPSLSDAFVLRPFSIPVGEDVEGLTDLSPQDDPFTTFRLNAAEFGVLSAGPDKRIQFKMRVDPDGRNRDNLVEVGP